MPAANRRDSDYPVGGLQRPGVSGRLDAHRTMDTLFIILIVAGICGFLAYQINKQPLAAALGFLLGPIGVLIACFIGKPKRADDEQGDHE